MTTPRSERTQGELMNFQIYPQVKLRSRTMAKKLIHHKNYGKNRDDSSSDDESVSQAPTRSIDGEDAKKPLNSKSSRSKSSHRQK